MLSLISDMTESNNIGKEKFKYLYSYWWVKHQMSL